IFKIVWQFSMEPEDFLTLIKEDPAGISQGDFLLVAVEQRHAKLCFNVLDRFADRRLGYIERCEASVILPYFTIATKYCICLMSIINTSFQDGVSTIIDRNTGF